MKIENGYEALAYVTLVMLMLLNIMASVDVLTALRAVGKCP